MGAKLIQSDFTHGELDRRMFSRVDLQVYNKSAQKLRNMVVIPQGGARRTFGTKFVETITQTQDSYMLTEFQFTETVNYLLLLEPGELTIFTEEAVQVFSTTAGIPWSADDLRDQTITFAQTSDQFLITNSDFIPIVLRRTSETIWTVINFSFKNQPTADFGDVDYDSAVFEMDETKIGKDRTLKIKGGSPNVFDTGHVGGLFRAIGPPDQFAGIGVARITDVPSSTEATVDVISEFDESIKDSETGIIGTQVDLEKPIYGDDSEPLQDGRVRGFPVCATFYEGRLWLAGTPLLQQLVNASVVGDFFDFDVGKGLDSDAIQATIGSNSSLIIKYILGDKTLQVFTDSAAAVIPQEANQAITPSNRTIRKQSDIGVGRVRPLPLDNVTFYVANGSKRVMSFDFDETVGSYRSEDASILSAQLIRNPIDGAVVSGSENDDANYLMLVNDDGTLAIFQTLSEQNVAAWTLKELNDPLNQAKFQRITEVGQKIYAIVSRTDVTGVLATSQGDTFVTSQGDPLILSQSTQHELVEVTFDALMDSSVIGTFATPTTTITGLDHLEDQVVSIRGETVSGEGFYVFPDEIVESGQITLETGVVTYEVGLDFTPRVQPMPVQVPAEDGQTLYLPKRLTRIFVDFYESVGVKIGSEVNGSLIPYLTFGDTVLDQPPEPQSDLFEFDNIGGWDRRQAPVLFTSQPTPITILGVGYEVDL